MTIKPLKSVKLFFRKTVSKQWKEPFVQLWVKGTKKILQTIHSYWLAWMNFWRERFFYFWTHKANQSFWWLHLAFYSYFILTYDRASFVMRMIFSLLRHIFWYCSFYWHYCARFFQVSRNLMMILFFWLFFTDWHFFPLLHNRESRKFSSKQLCLLTKSLGNFIHKIYLLVNLLNSMSTNKVASKPRNPETPSIALPSTYRDECIISRYVY